MQKRRIKIFNTLSFSFTFSLIDPWGKIGLSTQLEVSMQNNVQATQELHATQELKALPPWAQEQREVEAIIKALTENYDIDCNPEDIQKVGYGLYVISAHNLQAHIIPIEGDHRIGPFQFRVEFEELKEAVSYNAVAEHVTKTCGIECKPEDVKRTENGYEVNLFGNQIVVMHDEIPLN